MQYISGLLLGMTLQLSLGPVFFAVLHKALTEGGREALKMACGAATVDATYIALSFTGIALLLQIQILQGAVLVLGALVLIWFGLRYFLKSAKRVREDPMGISHVNNSSGGRIPSYIHGLKLTAVNPLTIIFWSSTFGTLIASGILKGTGEALLYACGAVSATFLFLGAISFLAPLLPIKQSSNTERYFDYFVGLVLILFGLVMFFRFVKIVT